MYGTNESFVHPSNVNGSYIADSEVSNDKNFVVELEESKDSIEMVENQDDPTYTDDIEFIPMTVDLKRFNETASTELTESETEILSLNCKNLHKKRVMKTNKTKEDPGNVTRETNGKKSSSMKSKSNDRFKCTVCKYVGLHMGNLNRHMRTHTGETPFKCNKCGRSFTNAGSLMIHGAIHIDEFPFHCRTCFHGFSLKIEALAHEKHCRKRHFECYLCKKFITCVKTDLLRHMRKHSGDKPFRCEICTKSFGWKYILKRHLNNVHSKASA